MDETSRSSFAMTCTSVYKDLEKLYAKKTAAIIYSPSDKLYGYIVSIKELQLRNGCLRLKFFPISKSRNNNCPVQILCFNAFSQLSILNELDCTRVNALIICLAVWKMPPFPFEKFPKLKSCTFESVMHDVMVENRLYIASKNHLEYISKRFCNTANGPLKIVETCAILQDNPSLDCKLSDATPIKPSDLKRYILGFYEVPEAPKMRSGEPNPIPSNLRGLDKLEIKCDLSRCLDCFSGLLTNLRMFTYHYEHIYDWENRESPLYKFLENLRLKSIMVLLFIDSNPNDIFRYRLIKGEEIVLVEFIRRGYSKPAHKIQLDPENPTVEYIPLDK